jgi:hypothetical protein
VRGGVVIDLDIVVPGDAFERDDGWYYLGDDHQDHGPFPSEGAALAAYRAEKGAPLVTRPAHGRRAKRLQWLRDAAELRRVTRPTSPREVLAEAANLVERGGLAVGELASGRRYCVIGAVAKALNDPWLGPTFRAALKMVADRLRIPVKQITAWNDAPGRTKRDVVSVLRAASAGAS